MRATPRDPGVGIEAGLVPHKGGVARYRRQRNAVGGRGREGPLPSPPPSPARMPLAPARANRTRRNHPLRGTSQPLACPCNPTAGNRAAAVFVSPCCWPPPFPPCAPATTTGGGWHLPPAPPPTPLPSPSPLTPTSSAASLAGRSESKREQTLGSFGEGGTGLKGTTTFFKPGKKWRGCQEGARPRVAPRLSGGNNVQKQWEYRRASAFRLRVLFLEAPPTP